MRQRSRPNLTCIKVTHVLNLRGPKMINKFEQSLLITHAHRLVTAFPARSVVARQLSDWMEEQNLGFIWDPDLDYNKRKGLPPLLWEELRVKIAQRTPSSPSKKPDLLGRNIATLATHMGLDQYEAQIFALAVRAARNGPLNALCSGLIEARLPIEHAVACLTGVSPLRVRKALANSARLVTTGLLYHEKQPVHGLGLLPSDRLLAAMEPPSRGLTDILGKLFGAAQPAQIAWEDFEHLGAGRDFAFRLIEGAVNRREKGVNILLHGVPGTGKTEFCKVLAARLGARLFAVGETDDDGDEPTRFERLQQLRLGQRLLADQGNSVILFDEMEDVLPGLDNGRFGMLMQRSSSKVHMNRLLENNQVPTLWTSNSISACDPAFLRRITFTLELRTPPVAVRTRIWRKLACQYRVPLSDDVCQELATSMDDAPALASSALRAANIVRGGSDEVRLAATALSRAVRGGHSPIITKGSARFDPALINADQDIVYMTERLIASGGGNIGGICLSGAPGTGKSAYARYLAEQLNMPAMERRASDLLDCFVGGTERKIADSFAEARDTNAFLIFDEADSLLGAREGAKNRWEVSQVNEMLTWMESHTLPFACTTNLLDRLDPATARRFSLRIRFLPLTCEQRMACFKTFFQMTPPARLRQLDQLTPGDFAVVAKRVALLGLTDSETILVELDREQRSKPDMHTPVGFQMAS